MHHRPPHDAPSSKTWPENTAFTHPTKSSTTSPIPCAAIHANSARTSRACSAPHASQGDHSPSRSRVNNSKARINKPRVKSAWTKSSKRPWNTTSSKPKRSSDEDVPNASLSPENSRCTSAVSSPKCLIQSLADSTITATTPPFWTRPEASKTSSNKTPTCAIASKPSNAHSASIETLYFSAVCMTSSIPTKIVLHPSTNAHPRASIFPLSRAVC